MFCPSFCHTFNIIHPVKSLNYFFQKRENLAKSSKESARRRHIDDDASQSDQSSSVWKNAPDWQNASQSERQTRPYCLDQSHRQSRVQTPTASKVCSKRHARCKATCKVQSDMQGTKQHTRCKATCKVQSVMQGAKRHARYKATCIIPRVPNLPYSMARTRL